LTNRKFTGAVGAVNAAWSNRTATPAMVTVALRDVVPVFAPTV
jgi:hypothetical protein